MYQPKCLSSSLLLLLASAACGEESKSKGYPFAGDCKGSGCGTAVIVGGGAVTTRVSDAGVPVEPDETVELSVRATVVAELAGVDGSQAVANNTSEVQVSLLERPKELAVTKGSGMVSLGWAQLPDWVRVDAPPGGTPQRFSSTLRWVDPSETPVQLFLAARAPFELIADALVVEPTQLKAGFGTILIQVLRQGAPLEGVSVLTSVGTVAYDLADTFSDAITETGARGQVIWFNAQGENGGRETNVSIVVDGKLTSVRAPVLPDGLTLLGVNLK